MLEPLSLFANFIGLNYNFSPKMNGSHERSAKSAVEASRDHYVGWVNSLSDNQRQHLAQLTTHIKKNRIDILDPSTLPAELTVGGVAKGIHISLIDFTVIEAFQSSETKVEYLRTRYEGYFNSLEFPNLILLALSQGIDFTRVIPKEDHPS